MYPLDACLLKAIFQINLLSSAITDIKSHLADVGEMLEDNGEWMYCTMHPLDVLYFGCSVQYIHCPCKQDEFHGPDECITKTICYTADMK